MNAIFGSLFGKKKSQEATAQQPEENGKGTAYLHLNAAGWSLAVTGDAPQVTGWNGLALEETGRNRVMRIAQEAVKANVHLFRQMNRLHLLLDDYGIEFTDDATLGTSTIPEKVREFGCSYLNTHHVTYGRGAFCQEHPEEQWDKGRENRQLFYHAFADVATLRDLLSLFEIHGKLLTRIVPSPHLWATLAAQVPQQTHAVLDIGAEESRISLVHHNQGVMMTRTLNVGLLTLAQDLDKSGGLGINNSLALLREKELLRTLPPTLSPSRNEASQMGDYERIISVHMRNKGILRFVKESLDYFAVQRGLGQPAVVWVTGIIPPGKEGKQEQTGYDPQGAMIEPIKGVCSWLSAGLNLPCNLLSSSPVEMMRDLPEQNHPCNLMAGSSPSQPLLIVNKVPYYFTEKGLQSHPAMPIKPKTSSMGTSQRRSRAKSSRAIRKGNTPESSSFHGDLHAGPGQWLQRLNMMLGSSHDANSDLEGQEEGGQKSRVIQLAAVLTAALVIYTGWDVLAKESVKTKQIANTYIKQRDEVRDLRKNSDDKKRIATLSKGIENKILWTEKILALSQAMDEHIWLTDIVVRHEKPESAENIEVNRLIINGRVLPSTDGHIQKISDYSSRLLNDKNVFMVDFDKLNFIESKLQHEEDVVKFSLEAWSLVQGSSKSENGDDGQFKNPVEVIKDANRKRDLELEKLSKKPGRR